MSTMERSAALLLAGAVLLSSGCSGDNRKASSSPDSTAIGQGASNVVLKGKTVDTFCRGQLMVERGLERLEKETIDERELAVTLRLAAESFEDAAEGGLDAASRERVLALVDTTKQAVTEVVTQGIGQARSNPVIAKLRRSLAGLEQACAG